MKNHKNAHDTSRHFLNLVLTACLALPLPSLATVAIATAPLATSTTSTVSPNVMFMLDDSGSMDWDYMPDDAKNFSGKYGFNSNHCNGVYYNPLITYNPPVDSTTKSYADPTSASYVNNTFTNAQTDGYNVGTTVNLDTDFTGGSGTGSSGINLTPSKAFYYTYSGTQTSGVQMDFHNTNSIFYKECNSAIGSTTAVDGTHPVNTLFTLVRLASTENATITVTAPGSGATATSVSSIKVNGVELLSALPASSSNASTLATNIAAKITLSGFSATASGSKINIIAPTSANGYTPVITVASGNLTFSANQFPDTDPTKLQNFANWYSYYSTRMLMMKTGVGQAFSPITDKYRVGFMTMNNNVSPDIVELDSFGTAQRSAWYSKLYASNPGNSTPLREALSNVGRLYAHQFTDQTIYTATIKVSGSTSTTVSSIKVNGVELLAGTSSSSSKSSTVAKNIVSQFIDPSDYTAVASSSTITITGPAAASGYAPVVTSSGGMAFAVTSFTSTLIPASLNGIDPKDPVQYSCQQNFVILSTDGYWNGNTTYDLSKPTTKPVGNQDGTAARPMYDGASFTKTTSRTYQSTSQKLATTSQILKKTTQVTQRTQQIQQRTQQITKRTVQNQKRTVQNQQRTQQITKRTVQNQQRTQQITKRTVQNQQRTQQITQRTQQVQQRTQQITKRTVQNQQRTQQIQQRIQQIQQRTLQIQQRTQQLQKTTSNSVNATTTIIINTAASPSTLSAVTINGSNRLSSNITVTSAANGNNVARRLVVANWIAAHLSGGYTGESSGSCTGADTPVTGCANGSSYVVIMAPAGSGTTMAAAATLTSSNSNADITYTSTMNNTGVVAGSTAPVTTNVSSCTAGTSASGNTLTTTTCNTTDTGFVNASSCTASSSGGQTITCQTTDTGSVNASTCTASGPTNGQTITCPTADTGFVNASSCTASGPTNGQTITCNTTDTGFVNIGTCTASGPTNGQTVTCNVLSDSGFVNASACAASNPASGPTVTCNTTDTGFVNASTCTASGPTNGQTITCQTADTGFVNASSCTASGPTNGQTVTCNTTDTGFVNIGTCTASGPTNGQTVTCNVASDTGFVNASSCTASNPASGPTVTCNTTDTGFVNVGTCTASGPTNGQTVTCNVASDTGFVNASSCSASNPASGPTVTCNTTDTGFVNIDTCTASGPTNGQTVTCNVASDTGWANIGTCTASNPASGPTVMCQVASDSGFVNASSCTASNPASGPTVTCNTTDTGFVNASSCTASSSGGQTITCQTNDTGFVAVSSCTASGPTNGLTISCGLTDTGWVGAPSCTDSTSNGLTVLCWSPSPLVTGPTPVASCTAGTSSCSSPYTAASCMTTSCNTVATGPTLVASCTAASASLGNSYTATTCSTTTLSTATGVSCIAGNTGAPSYIQTTCTNATGGTSDTLADVAMYYYQTDLRNASLNNCTGGASIDFPSGTDVCQDNVFIAGLDNNVKQHMTTYTLGLGARGRMVYTSKDYMNDTSGDFYSVKTGATTNLGASPPVCSWQASGVCNWPIPASGQIANIDDLWHAAVNGRGTYFSATDPAALSDGLTSALSSITARKGAAAAAATSTLNPVAGNNYAYVASYTTVKWIGNLEARTINTTNGVIDKTASWCVENLTADTCAAPSTIVPDSSGNSTVYNCVTPNSTAASCTYPSVFDSNTNNCSLQMALACNGTMPNLVGPSSDTRTIYTANGPTYSGTNLGLVNFTYANLNSADFDATRLSSLSQWPALTATQQGKAVGANLVNYLRGQNGYEDRAVNLVGAVDNRIYRFREAVLGDALESQPSYIAAPTFSYADTGYSAFVTANASREGTVYMGTNDGMMHAFNAVTGIERWSYVPSMVVPNMWKLADKDYGTNHVNFINGSPVLSDYYCTQDCGGLGGAPSWRTILVGGLNGGGRGYYALDITVPNAPTLLWEFTASKAAPYGDANLGYSFGLPVVTKMADGKWVVLVTSGYDNGTDSATPKVSPLTGFVANSPAGDGMGHLYVLDAQTGAIIKTLSTGVGTAASPSGLAKIAAWNSVPSSNQAGYVYGGDLLGNVWRFDINSASSPFLFATLKDPSGNPQPVTTTPTLGEIVGKRVIFVGTGKYLEKSDLSNPQVASMYAIKDDNAIATLVNPRTYSATAPYMVQQTITPSGSIRTGSKNPVNFVVDRGWFVDFPDIGERVNIDSRLVLGVLLVPTIVPSSTVCSPGGYGWLNFFDYMDGWPTTDPSGTAAQASNVNVSIKYDATIVGMNILYIGGKPIIEVVTSDNPTPTQPQDQPPIAPPVSNFTGKRMQWRELIP